MDSVEKILSFFEIFQSVSLTFEKDQGEWPLNIFRSSAQSSFREGDLQGNFLAFFMAVNRADYKAVEEKYKGEMTGWITEKDTQKDWSFLDRSPKQV